MLSCESLWPVWCQHISICGRIIESTNNLLFITTSRGFALPAPAAVSVRYYNVGNCVTVACRMQCLFYLHVLMTVC